MSKPEIQKSKSAFHTQCSSQLTLGTASHCMLNLEEEVMALGAGHLDSCPKLTHSKTNLPSEVSSKSSGVGIQSLENGVGGRTGKV